MSAIPDLKKYFDAMTFLRGGGYQREGLVLEATRRGDLIYGKVSGSRSQIYRQQIKLTRHGAKMTIAGICSCPMEHNCKHVVAVLLELQAREPAAPTSAVPAAAPLPDHVTAWLRDLMYANIAERGRAPAARSATHRAIFVLMPDKLPFGTQLSLCKGKLGRDGGIVSATIITDFYRFSASWPDYVTDADQLLVQLFTAMRADGEFGIACAVPQGALGAELMGRLLAAGCLYWADSKVALKGVLAPMHAAPAVQGELTWRMPDGAATHAQLVLQGADGAPIPYVLHTVPPMCVSQQGLSTLALPPAMAALPLTRWMPLLAYAPPVAVVDLPAVARQVGALGLVHMVPAPSVPAASTRDDVLPVPVLLLGSAYDPRTSDWQEYALLAYDYDGVRVGSDPAEPVSRFGPAGLELITRNSVAESAAAASLAGLGLESGLAMRQGQTSVSGLDGEWQLASSAEWLRFVTSDLPALRAQGWQVEIGKHFRFDLRDIDDWYAQVEQPEGEGSAWFDLELGIIVDGDKIALLPVLLKALRESPHDFSIEALAARPADAHLIVNLPGAGRVALPWHRIRPILQTLGELYFNDRIGDSVRMPALDMARLAELDASVQLRWVGGERLRQLGHQLRDFERVQPVATPQGLQASLRPYQSDGLAWMQFLREYGLAGILADDMGLGKTIQTLSHILVEKEAGRLSAPALVVAPTSLMANWQAEAARFAPGLRVLLLHGPDRGERYDQIADHDVVLTSYALLPRDEAALRAQQFHLVILDESQYIKNHRAKVAQTAVLLNARHRLCLTGTPLQNHLGELWSQFHFLMPGLLGDEKTFNAQFRKPIEQQGDTGRNAFLIRRVQPFLLRRTKDNVAKELPPKIEMVHHVELAGAQRDLYETVRVAMDGKVRDAIAAKGAARSQIVILDALLKLRQVCCDPRLVKADGRRKAAAPIASAKLEALLALLEELLAEDRKIIVFSQFTSMLALIEAELTARGVPYSLLTGDTRDRAAQVDAFQQGRMPVFLISLKAGGVGLNLTAADTVIHYDPWWNPAAENQATDRAWRIGQDKTVFVYRLIATGTLEEKIQELQRRKSDLADAVLAADGTQSLPITADDLLSIFAPA